MLTTTNCPLCGAVLTLVPREGHPGRLEGRCKCVDGRAVIEVAAAQGNGGGDNVAEIATIIFEDGIDDEEASVAGKALQQRGSKRKSAQ